MALISCSTCRRHSRADSGVCAFCGGALAGPAAPAVHNLGSLSRAALLALAVSGCNRSSETIVQPYGAPPQPTPQLDAGAPDVEVPMATLYGAPPPAANGDAGAPVETPRTPKKKQKH